MGELIFIKDVNKITRNMKTGNCKACRKSLTKYTNKKGFCVTCKGKKDKISKRTWLNKQSLTKQHD